MVWVIGLAALPSNSYIYLGLIRHCDSISRIWQTVSTNFSLIKLYYMAQVLANIVAIILFLGVYCIVNKLP